MVNYQEGKIYMIWFENCDKIYYGSTTSTLPKRFYQHKNNYKLKKSCTLFVFFDLYGVDNANIELVEAYPCENRAELEAREGFYIRNNNCINRNITGRTVEEKKEMAKKRREARIDDARACCKKYKSENREKIKEYNKQYQKEHREERNARQRALRQKKKAELKKAIKNVESTV
jgi:hypothetical protein